jgi:hypothetical protein
MRNQKEINKKISASLKGNIPWNKGKVFKKKHNKICKCGVLFHRADRKYCSKECYMKYTDYSEANKKAYRNGRKASGGTCKFLSYKNIKVQGTYELRMCSILDKMKEAGEILDWEYTNDRIKYVSEDGLERNYLFDFKVVNNDGSFKYLEVKGFVQPRDRFKWAAAKEQNIDLQIVFKSDIIELENNYQTG